MVSGYHKKTDLDNITGSFQISYRAYEKALWHGQEILPSVYEISEGFSQFSHRGAICTMDLLLELKPVDPASLGSAIDPGKSIYARLFSNYLNAQAGRLPSDVEVEFLVKATTRSIDGIESPLYVSRVQG